MEENLRPKDEIIKTVQELSRRLGRERVVWRYDPILLNDSYTVARHLMWFEKALAELSSYVERCVISFIDMYAKMKKNTVGLNLRVDRARQGFERHDMEASVITGKLLGDEKITVHA